MGHLWLIGMMGTGKTAAGSVAAGRIGVPFYDVDDEVARGAGQSIAALWNGRGEGAFRQLEQEAMSVIASQTAGVVATGGGVVMREANVSTMRNNGRVVWLQASPSTLADRLRGTEGRPLLSGGADSDRLGELLAAREAAYATAADGVVDTEGREVSEVARLIEAEWNASP